MEEDQYRDLVLNEWDFVHPPLGDFLCGNCKLVLRKPMLTACCETHFCSTCIELAYDAVEKVSYKCPNCEEKDITTILDKQKWNKILELDVKCPFSSQGCQWTGELRARVAHLNPNTGCCQYVTVNCKYGCGETLNKEEREEHLEFFCPKRPAICQHCSEENEHDFIHGKHKSECPELLIDCPNNCGAHFKQSNKQNHLKECLMEVVECEFSYAGCTRRTLRKDLIEHFDSDCQAHLAHITRYFMMEIHKRDQHIKQLIETQKDQLATLSKTFREELNEAIEKIAKERIEEHYDERKNATVKEIEEKLMNIDTKCDGLMLNISALSQSTDKVKIGGITLTSLIRTGKTNAEIWRGTFNGIEVAIKRPKPGSFSSDIVLEAQILEKLTHTNIVKVYQVTTSDPVSIVMEFLPMGNLMIYLENNYSSLLLHQQVDICEQVASGLDYLQQKHCIHRKIQASNILLGEREKLLCKIKDFSYAVLVDDQKLHTFVRSGKIPVRSSPPEFSSKPARFCLKSDVWSFGSLIWEVATGNEPYPDISDDSVKIKELILAGHLMPRPVACPQEFYRIMLNCWKKDPQTRPTFKTLNDMLDCVKKSHKYAYVT